MNSFGASEGDSPRPWWRSRTRHDRLMAEEVRRAYRDTVSAARPDTDKLGFSPNESIRLDNEADMMSVRALIHVLQDEPDKARSIVRVLSRPEIGMLLFHAGELSRLVSEEDMFRTDTDRRTARRTYERTNPDSR